MGNCTIINCTQDINDLSFNPSVTPDPDITGVGVRLLLAHHNSLSLLLPRSDLLLYAVTGSSSIRDLWVVDTRALPSILYNRSESIDSTP